MMETIFPFTAALLAAMLHVITGPDHLAAVVPFAVESKRKAWKIGLSWGIGHLVGMLSIGLLFMVFKELIPVEQISDYSEQLVGFVLIGIGVWAFYNIYKRQNNHAHLHVHSEKAPVIHRHTHDHGQEITHAHHHSPQLKQSHWASFSVGFLHGLAGIAHFLLFLPVLSFEKQTEAFSYVIGFGVGIVLAMTVFAFVIGTVASLSKNGHNDVFFKGIRLAGGLFAIVIGVYWILSA